MSTTAKENQKQSRAERLRDYLPTFPVEKSVPPSWIPKSPDQPEESPVVISVDYLRLRTILRDRGLTFQPIFGQRDVAGTLGKSDKTVRA